MMFRILEGGWNNQQFLNIVNEVEKKGLLFSSRMLSKKWRENINNWLQDTLPYDNNRVILKSINDNDDDRSTYINASYVNVNDFFHL